MRLAGHNGPPEHHRQRYMCVPDNGDRPHRFSEALPREQSWTDDCELCERDVGFHEGPHAARRYQFVARGIAGALAAVGAGQTYRQAALVARERAKRLRADPETGEPRFSRHGSLVMDWVEVFAPVVFEPYRPREWPPSGSLLLDDLPFSVRSGGGRPRIAFRIFCAMGYEDGRARMWRMEAFPSKSQADWEAFLGGLDGAPGRVVCDNDLGLTAAVRARFSGAELHLCEWHLRHALERLMKKTRSDEAEHAEAIDELLPEVEAAFAGAAFWAPFRERVHGKGIPRLSEWLNTTGRIVAEQFARRGPRSARPADMPLSTSPLDAFVHPIRESIQPPAYGLKNRERTNRMLMLMQLHANRQDDERTYVRHIREWLEANHGRPSVDRRAIVDVGGVASLR